MKKGIKIITFFIIILIVIVVHFYKEERIKENSKRQALDNNKIIDVQIIDKYNLMQKLYDNPEEEKYVEVDIIIDGNYYNNVGIRTKGNIVYKLINDWGLNHYSYKVKLNYKDKEQKYKGMTEFHLNTSIVDSTGIREHTVYDIYNLMGIETQNYSFGHLHIDKVDRGLITIVEVINEEYVEQKYNFGNGNLYKPEGILNEYNEIESYSGADLRYIGENIEDYVGIFNKIETQSTTENNKKELINIIKKINETSNTEVIENCFMDFDKIIKIIAVNKVLFTLDVFTGVTTRNYYLYEENGKIDILPFDLDRSMEPQYDSNYWTEDMNEYDLSKSDIKIYSRIIEIIVENEEFNQRYNRYLEDTRQLLKDINIEEFIDKKCNLTKDVVEQNERKIHYFGSYEKNIKKLKEFLKQRVL